jgi:class 3 adenylate cyclase/tetratricopeptide (TPR) repeat protein
LEAGVVRCRSCRRDIPDGTPFCGYCGEKVVKICAACGAGNPVQFSFCGQCGQGLAAESPQEETASVRPLAGAPQSAVERRQLTILFVDLVGSTQMSRALDPEILRELIGDYRRHVADAVIEVGGEIAHYMGDGVLAYFGYPQAHENDAARGVHAAVEIVRRITRARHDFERLYGVRPQVRLGIHTGMVVAGDLATGALYERMSVVGDTPNIAARFQELARPDSIVVGSTTARLVSRYFRLRDLGRQRLKGLDEDFEVFEVAAPTGIAEPVEHAQAPATGFYGRAHELNLIWERWLCASVEGQGQIVVIEGDAGMGKSRLVREFGDRVAGSAHSWIELLGSAFAINSAFAPVVQALRREMGRQDPLEELDAKGRLSRVLGEVAALVPESMLLVGELLDLSPEEIGDLTADWSPARRRQRLLESLVAWVLGRGQDSPVVLAVEDIHWMDPSTREFVTMLVRHAPTGRLLVLVTHRTDFPLDWLRAAHVTLVRLPPLAAHDVDAMIQEIVLKRSVPRELVKAIAGKADGVPLYVEEITRTMVDRGLAAMAADVDSLPDTLRDSLMERLDRLPLGRAVVQTASVIGRTFDFEDLLGLVGVGPSDLTRTLDVIVADGIVFQRGFAPEATYIFKHSLIRDAAYDSLLVRNRREIHRKLADAMDEKGRCPPELVAFHYSAAGMPEQAHERFFTAGREAHREGALKESLAHFDSAEVELKKMMPGKARDEREMQLQIARGAVLLALKGYGALEVRMAYERAMELADLVRDEEASFATLWGLSSYFNVAGPADLAREVADRAIASAAAAGDAFRHAEACRRRGLVAFVAGEFREAERFYAAAHELLAEIPDSDAPLFGTRPGSLLRNNTAWLLWFVGQPVEALNRARETVEHARRLKDPYAVVFALGVAAAIAQHAREPGLAREFAAECLELSDQQQFSYWSAWSKIFGGWADAIAGAPPGLDQIRSGLEEYRATGAAQLELCALTLLADALVFQGELTAAEHALQAIDTGKLGVGLYFLSEMWRLAAVVSLARGEAREDTLAKIDKAVDVAGQQGATMLELRARAWKAACLPETAREENARLRELHCKVRLAQGSSDAQLLEAALRVPSA